MINQYKAQCHCCKAMVPAGAGQAVRFGRQWRVYHNHCIGRKPTNYISNVITFNSGATIYQNKKGRCEDAPCCGCCS